MTPGPHLSISLAPAPSMNIGWSCFHASWVVMTETGWPAQPKLFTTCSWVGKFAGPRVDSWPTSTHTVFLTVLRIDVYDVRVFPELNAGFQVPVSASPASGVNFDISKTWLFLLLGCSDPQTRDCWLGLL